MHFHSSLHNTLPGRDSNSTEPASFNKYEI